MMFNSPPFLLISGGSENKKLCDPELGTPQSTKVSRVLGPTVISSQILGKVEVVSLLRNSKLLP